MTTSGNQVLVGGIVIGTFAIGPGGGGFNFNSDATPAAVQELVRAITFNNLGGISPTPGVRTINWVLKDGDGTANGGNDTLSFSTTVDVQAINDAPTGQDATYMINEDTTYTFSEASFTYADVNGDDFSGVVVTTVAVPGTLFFDSDGAGGAAPVAVSAGQFISAADIALGHFYFMPGADLNGSPYTSFTFQVRDAPTSTRRP